MAVPIFNEYAFGELIHWGNPVRIDICWRLNQQARAELKAFDWALDMPTPTFAFMLHRRILTENSPERKTKFQGWLGSVQSICELVSDKLAAGDLGCITSIETRQYINHFLASQLGKPRKIWLDEWDHHCCSGVQHDAVLADFDWKDEFWCMIVLLIPGHRDGPLTKSITLMRLDLLPQGLQCIGIKLDAGDLL
uniref:Uncharacterized protein n=1 Tax=Coccidioides posadasii RMSCC 3488 TaxID=454284 RepID=A0A0J6IBB5_COCPO|nr:hypothetical protein CPAG_05265 [Coccidioides posadasii RMSCC 3488]